MNLNRSIQRSIITLQFFFISFFVFAGEGMWLPFLLKSLNEAEMKSMGMKMSAEDIYSVNHGSLKDAVVHFGGFCTAEVVSDQGLIFTNHHCGYDAIQSHSTIGDNLLTNGFWASSLENEKPNPGLFATFIIRIEDVSEKVLLGVTDNMDAKERQSLIDKNIRMVTDSTQKESWQNVMVRPFFEGTNYYLFVTETYNDVRLVGAPPESIGKFGADTDNWVWPRHTGDFSVFRIYAGPDNKPAEYSPDNKPLRPRHYFPVSLDGIEDGDFTLVFGFPGRTNQYLPSFAVDQVANVIDPARIGVRDISLGIMDKHMRTDEASRLALAVRFAGLANSWKKWIGERQGINSTHAVQKKELQEKNYAELLSKNKDLCKQYENVLPTLKKLYAAIEPFAHNRTIMAEVIGGSNIEFFWLTNSAGNILKAIEQNGGSGYVSAKDQLLLSLDEYFKAYQKEIEKEVFIALMDHLKAELDPKFLPPGFDGLVSRVIDSTFNGSVWMSKEAFADLLSKGPTHFKSVMENDPAFQLYSQLKKVVDEQLNPSYISINNQIQPLLRDYLVSLMAVYPEKRFWPDANNTMRIAYGQVEPYEPRDAVKYETQTYLDGVMEKYKPGDYEFDVHPKLIELYEKKDYGEYGEDGKMPVCFIASNHSTGGNSGSPAIDAHGNLIGINFDRVWEGTMSDLYYDRSICRNIMVDVRYVLFVIDKFAGADRLIREMKLVHPKK